MNLFVFMDLWSPNTEVTENLIISIDFYYEFFLVEWSMNEQFDPVSFEIVRNGFLREYIIKNLPLGERCYVRVSAGNIKGFGQSVPSNPSYGVPSSLFLFLS